jgi:hypothetical protein
MVTRTKKIAEAMKGNDNAQVRGQFSALLRRMTVQEPERLHKVANELFKQAEEGNLNAISILFDRLDGKPHQAIDIDAKVDLTQKNQYVDDLLRTIESNVD